jgi:hypothetical protein
MFVSSWFIWQHCSNYKDYIVLNEKWHYYYEWLVSWEGFGWKQSWPFQTATMAFYLRDWGKPWRIIRGASYPGWGSNKGPLKHEAVWTTTMSWNISHNWEWISKLQVSDGPVKAKDCLCGKVNKQVVQLIKLLQRACETKVGMSERQNCKHTSAWNLNSHHIPLITSYKISWCGTNWILLCTTGITRKYGMLLFRIWQPLPNTTHTLL